HGRAVHRVVDELHELHADLARQRPHELRLGDEPQLHERAAEGLTALLLLGDGIHQLVFSEHARLKEDGSQLLHGISLDCYEWSRRYIDRDSSKSAYGLGNTPCRAASITA